MESFFSAEFFKGNRDNLRKVFRGKAPIIITANGLLQKSADTTFSFKQDSNFWYLTGINQPDIVLVMDKDKEYLLLPPRDKVREVFDGSIDVKQLKQTSGIKNVFEENEGWKLLQIRLSKVKHAATLAALPSYDARHGMYANPARKFLIKKILAANAEIELLDLRQHLAKLRTAKQEPEIAALREAAKLTVESFKTVYKKLNAFKYEYEVEAMFTNLFKKEGHDHAYEPIVAGGARACILHYINNDQPIKSSELLLIDIGAQVNNYAADITRTYAIGRASKRQQGVHSAVLDIQEFAKSLLKPGVILQDYEKQVEKFAGEKLRELSLIKTITHDKVRKYYPHAASHFLGLDVHDIGDYKSPLQPGTVLTVEPGIYIPKEATGIRLEDDVLITTEGIEVLSKNLPGGMSA